MGIYAFVGMIFLLSILFTCSISLVLFLLRAFGLYRMAKNLNLPHAWIAFVSFLQSYQLGVVADRASGDGKNTYSKLMLTLKVISFVLSVAMIFALPAFIETVIDFFAESFESVEIAGSVNFNGFHIVLPLAVPLLNSVLGLVNFIHNIVFALAANKLYGAYGSQNPALWAVLGFFIAPINPIYVFMLRNRPVAQKTYYTYE